MKATLVKIRGWVQYYKLPSGVTIPMFRATLGNVLQGSAAQIEVRVQDDDGFDRTEVVEITPEQISTIKELSRAQALNQIGAIVNEKVKDVKAKAAAEAVAEAQAKAVEDVATAEADKAAQLLMWVPGTVIDLGKGQVVVGEVEGEIEKP